MLSSRYLHLHQALGLGPMWLNRHAKVIPPAGDASVTQPQKPAAAQVAEAVRTISASAHHARMAAMAAVQHEKTTSATTPPIPPSDAPAFPIRADTFCTRKHRQNYRRNRFRRPPTPANRSTSVRSHHHQYLSRNRRQPARTTLSRLGRRPARQYACRHPPDAPTSLQNQLGQSSARFQPAPY